MECLRRGDGAAVNDSKTEENGMSAEVVMVRPTGECLLADGRMLTGQRENVDWPTDGYSSHVQAEYWQ